MGVIWKMCFFVSLKEVICIMMDSVFMMKMLLMMVRMILCLMVMLIELSVVLRDNDLVFFINIIVGGVLNYKNLRFVFSRVL